MLTDEQIKALRDGCEGVERGPWAHSWSEYLGNAVRDPDGNCVACDMEKLDAAHIARCDPQTISELCTRVLEAEARVRELEPALDTVYYGLKARVKVLEDALKAAADSMTCKPNGPDAAHYCPNCDNDMYGPRDAARKALETGR